MNIFYQNKGEGINEKYGVKNTGVKIDGTW
jgi:hypothetical protein